MSTEFVTMNPITRDDFVAVAVSVGMTMGTTSKGAEMLVGAQSECAFYDIVEKTLADGLAHVAFTLRGVGPSEPFQAHVPCCHDDTEEYDVLHRFGPLDPALEAIFIAKAANATGFAPAAIAAAIRDDDRFVLRHGLTFTADSLEVVGTPNRGEITAYVDGVQALLLYVQDMRNAA